MPYCRHTRQHTQSIVFQTTAAEHIQFETCPVTTKNIFKKKKERNNFKEITP